MGDGTSAGVSGGVKVTDGVVVMVGVLVKVSFTVMITLSLLIELPPEKSSSASTSISPEEAPARI